MMMDNIKGLWERFYPAIISVFATIILVLKVNLTNLPAQFENILNGIITFSSIIIGFIGVLISILLTLKESKLIKELFKQVQGRILKRYFKFSLISGLLVVSLSLILYFNNRPTLLINRKEIDVILALWLLLLIYFVMSSLRIIDIMMHIIFKEHNPDTNPKGKELPEEKASALKKKLKRRE